MTSPMMPMSGCFFCKQSHRVIFPSLRRDKKTPDEALRVRNKRRPGAHRFGNDAMAPDAQVEKARKDADKKLARAKKDPRKDKPLGDESVCFD